MVKFLRVQLQSGNQISTFLEISDDRTLLTLCFCLLSLQSSQFLFECCDTSVEFGFSIIQIRKFALARSSEIRASRDLDESRSFLV
ncbi:hypothetical protein A2U01_0058747 [Trifolium medium]|uniref:Uncharacterized protein n=1 Tax=Trifolium medium TaxID=97028 RepID=A0A392RLL4_9FABA|nr:hypothetical protein [Trifolium medium]